MSELHQAAQAGFSTGVDRLLSTSFVAALDAATRAEIADKARRVLAAHGLGATVSFPYQTRAFATTRLS